MRYVGGFPDMMSRDEKHLYRFEKVSVLSKRICGVFVQMDQIK